MEEKAETGWIGAGRRELSSGFTSHPLDPGTASTGTIRVLQPRVLVFEEASAAQGYAGELTERGYQVGMATSAAAAFETARSGFDVALVHLHKPDHPDLRFVAGLKQACPSGQVVLLAGHATLRFAAALQRVGAFACLFKPCPRPKLLRTIDLAVARSRQRASKPVQGELVWPAASEAAR